MKADELTVGVIGGMGPYATLAFFKSVLDNTPAQKDWEHLRIIIDNNPKIPSRTRAVLFNEEDPVDAMLRSAKALEAAGADFLVVPCNSAHYFLPRLRARITLPFIDMIDKTCEQILAEHGKVVGLLAGEVTVRGGLYEQRLDQHNIKVLNVSDDEQLLVREIIESVKQNSVNGSTNDNMRALVQSLENQGADTIVLGCTELPMAMNSVVSCCTIVDSLDVLAKAVVQKAMAR